MLAWWQVMETRALKQRKVLLLVLRPWFQRALSTGTSLDIAVWCSVLFQRALSNDTSLAVAVWCSVSLTMYQAPQHYYRQTVFLALIKALNSVVDFGQGHTTISRTNSVFDFGQGPTTISQTNSLWLWTRATQRYHRQTVSLLQTVFDFGQGHTTLSQTNCQRWTECKTI